MSLVCWSRVYRDQLRCPLNIVEVVLHKDDMRRI